MNKEPSNQQKDENQKPHWKRDFPYKQSEGVSITRREFAKFLCLVSGGMVAGNGFVLVDTYYFPEAGIDGRHFVCNADEVAPGGMKAFTVHETPYILIHLKDGSWRAFEQNCTHLSCSVFYNKEEDNIECPCHSGYFNARTGDVIQGPPPRGLAQLNVEMEEGKVYVTEPPAS